MVIVFVSPAFLGLVHGSRSWIWEAATLKITFFQAIEGHMPKNRFWGQKSDFPKMSQNVCWSYLGVGKHVWRPREQFRINFGPPGHIWSIFTKINIFTFFQIFSSVFMPKNECFHRELSLRNLKKSIFQKVDLILKIHPVRLRIWSLSLPPHLFLA